MSTETSFTQANGVGQITLTRPARRNALSLALLAQLTQHLHDAQSLGLRAVIVQGQDGFFSAGADLAELRGTVADAGYDDQVAATADVIRAASMPVIACIEGGCLGAGLDLALACDFQVVAQSAFLELPALRLGILYNPQAVIRMARRVPAATLSRLLLAGERINGCDGVATGLATHCAADGLAAEAAQQLARRFTTVAPQAASATKQLLAALRAPNLDARDWEGVRRALLASPERAEAVRRPQKVLASDE